MLASALYQSLKVYRTDRTFKPIAVFVLYYQNVRKEDRRLKLTKSRYPVNFAIKALILHRVN
jgi:hypothetical protein